MQLLNYGEGLIIQMGLCKKKVLLCNAKNETSVSEASETFHYIDAQCRVAKGKFEPQNIISITLVWSLPLKQEKDMNVRHYVKGVHFQSFSGPYFPAFGLHTDQKNSEYGQFSRIAWLLWKLSSSSKCNQGFLNI